jgi:hypothetical protein
MAQGQRQILLRRTVLVVVEGETEFAFCRYLKATLSRGRNLRVNIKPARGGSPDAIVDYARRQMKPFPHDQLVMVFDADRSLSGKSRAVLENFKAEIISSSPCIEGLFLEILGHPKSATSAECKRRFHEVGLGEKEKMLHDAYGRLFPIEKMDHFCRHPDFARLCRLFGQDQR